MDFKNLMAQATKMQREMEKQENALKETKFTGKAGNDDVVVTVNGAYEVVSIEIKDELMSVDNKEIVQDYLTLALNGALKAVTDKKNQGFENLSNSLNINQLLK